MTISPPKKVIVFEVKEILFRESNRNSDINTVQSNLLGMGRP